jgi:hypothetical protein
MRRFCALALLLLLSACASAQGLRPTASGPPPGGVSMLYSQKQDAVYAAALSALPAMGLKVVETNPDQGYILAERGLNLMSNGENVGVYLQPQGQGTRVTVVSRRKTATNVAAKDFSMPVHQQLGAILGRTGQ